MKLENLRTEPIYVPLLVQLEQQFAVQELWATADPEKIPKEATGVRANGLSRGHGEQSIQGRAYFEPACAFFRKLHAESGRGLML